MKKTAILLLTFAMMQLLSAQENNTERKESWRASLQIVQHFGTNKWSNVGYVNDGFSMPILTEFRDVCYRKIAESCMGIFMDVSIGIMPTPKMKSFSLDIVPMPHGEKQYYLREMLSESSSNRSTHLKMTGGAFVEIPVNKERISMIVYTGIGILLMPKKEYEMILKEHGSNVQYQTRYIWNRNSKRKEDEDAATSSYISFRYNFMYKLNNEVSLIFGFEATPFLNTLNFYGEHINTFNANVERDFSIKGNKMNMLGFSVGLSFQ